MKISIVITVLNEQHSITGLLESIFLQTKKANEVIIVDGGSTDKTVSKIKKFTGVKVYIKKGNRSKARNFGIKKAKNEIIAITDGGCVLDKNWLKNITNPFINKKIGVVSGYYKINSSTIFEKCVGVYTLVMPDKINSRNFLPSSRSMAIRKNIFLKSSKFPEKSYLNEDYVFAHKLVKQKIKFHFAKNAIVYWKPRKNLKEAFVMFFNYAKGDSLAGIFRPKVVLIFARYVAGLILLFCFLITGLYVIVYTIYFILGMYIFWSIGKNFKYIKHWQALVFLPILQFTSDIAVLAGTIRGVIK